MKNKNKKIIGILGGIGPEATGEFYLKVIKKFQKKGLIGSNTDFPQIIVNSIPAPELIYNNISNSNLKPYAQGLKELESFGADFIVMACNTIHLFYEELNREIKIPILNVSNELKNVLLEKEVKTLTILGTPMTIRRGLYRFSHFNYLDVDEKSLNILSNSIFNFNKGYKKNDQIKAVSNITRECLDKGAEVIVLGCTELEVMLEKEHIPAIKPLDILADASIRHFLKNI